MAYCWRISTSLNEVPENGDGRVARPGSLSSGLKRSTIPCCSRFAYPSCNEFDMGSGTPKPHTSACQPQFVGLIGWSDFSPPGKLHYPAHGGFVTDMFRSLVDHMTRALDARL